MDTKQKVVLQLLLAPCAVFAAGPSIESCRAVREASARLACYDAMPLAPPPGAAAGAAMPSSHPAASTSFGLRRASQEPDAVLSHIPGRFDGWQARSRFRLANGQLWEISDGSSAVYYLVDPKVRIRRGAMGTFFLEIEGKNHTPRVHRIE